MQFKCSTVFPKNTLHIWGVVWETKQSLTASILMWLQEWAGIITLRWCPSRVLWLLSSVETSPVDSWVVLCAQLKAQREMTNMLLDVKAFLFSHFRLLEWGKRGLIFSLSCFILCPTCPASHLFCCGLVWLNTVSSSTLFVGSPFASSVLLF